MKETKEQETLPISDLVVEGVYFNTKNNLVQIKKIDTIKKEINVFNLSEQCNLYYIPFHRHNLVKRVH